MHACNLGEPRMELLWLWAPGVLMISRASLRPHGRFEFLPFSQTSQTPMGNGLHLDQQGGEVVEQEGLFLKARIPYAGSILKAGGFDSIDFLFVPSCNTVTFRSTASVDTAPQPFCVTPGCVNGKFHPVPSIKP